MWKCLLSQGKNTECLSHLSAIARINADTANVLLSGERGAECYLIHELVRDAGKRVDDVHKLVNEIFITSIDRDKIILLAQKLDETAKGMRKVSDLIDVHGDRVNGIITKHEVLHKHIERLFSMVNDMSAEVYELVTLLASKHIDVQRCERGRVILRKMEHEADEIRKKVEHILVAEERRGTLDTIGFIVVRDYVALLEKCTDHANGCGKVMLAIAQGG